MNKFYIYIGTSDNVAADFTVVSLHQCSNFHSIWDIDAITIRMVSILEKAILFIMKFTKLQYIDLVSSCHVPGKCQFFREFWEFLS